MAIEDSEPSPKSTTIKEVSYRLPTSSEEQDLVGEITSEEDDIAQEVQRGKLNRHEENLDDARFAALQDQKKADMAIDWNKERHAAEIADEDVDDYSDDAVPESIHTDPKQQARNGQPQEISSDDEDYSQDSYQSDTNEYNDDVKLKG